MKHLLVVCFLLFIQIVNAQNKISILPEPVSVTPREGVFTLNNHAVIQTVSFDNSADNVADFLISALKATGFTFTKDPNATHPVFKLSILSTVDAELGKEGYRLSVSSSGVKIEANEAAGLFYGVQSFLQLLPAQIESKTVVNNVTWTAPCAEIKDYPRFGWRGLMFDVSRHFFTKEEVKDFIDEMVKFKYNLLHIHLTDDQGWRIEIKTYPKLTSVGAWNVKKEGRFNQFSKPTADEPRDYGGFYTHDDIREIVAYAGSRYVNVLPEIDVPGHSLAAVAAYPELSCTPGADKYVVNSGEPVMVWPPGGGHFYALVDNNLCPANEKVYSFLDKVFTEVAELFPFEYIHMGGDETARNFWEKSPAVKALMQKEKLKNLDEVQSYFVKRVAKIIESKGKKMIGWDEILQGGIAPNAAVMSWQGMKGGIAAAKQHHEVVMSPTTHVYLDYMQGDAALEPPVYASLRLNKTYTFDPLPQGVDPKFIKGGQANLWTEQVYNTRHLQYMLWPRALAVSESVWSPADKKDWDTFVAKVEHQFKRFDAAEVKYAPSIYDPIVKVTKNSKNLPVIELTTEIKGLDIYYSFDHSFPDHFYPQYKAPVTTPKDAQNIKVITYRDGKPIGRMMTITMAELKKRAGIK